MSRRVELVDVPQAGSAFHRPSALAALSPRQQERRQRVVDAGLALLRRRDYDRIQVRDVAEEAGVALGTLYSYFGSKDRLFAEVLVTWAASLRADVTAHPLAGTGPAERLAEALQRSVRAFQRQPQLARLLATLEVSPDPFAAEIISRLEEATSAVYLDALDGVDPDRARALVRVTGAVLSSALRAWAAGRQPIVAVFDRVDEAVALLAP